MRILSSVLGLVAAVGLGVVATIVLTPDFGVIPSGDELKRVEQSPHSHDGRFENAPPTGPVGFGRVLFARWMAADDNRRPVCPLPLFEGGSDRLVQPPRTGLRVTWLGHSTALVEIDGKTILTDPMWSDRASPLSFLGPKRFHPPPIPLNRLPHVDAVIISHDHYDHLDRATVEALAKAGSVFHVGLGVGADLARWGVPADQIREYDWGDTADLGDGVRLVSTPARHWSARIPFVTNRTLWTSWAILGPTHRVYFSGDTSWAPFFADIGSRYGPFDVAMIEIGAFAQVWAQNHLGPISALDAAQAVNARLLLPIHWSTFNLGLHRWSDPAETVYSEAARRGVALATPLLGQPFEPAVERPSSAWWRALPPFAEHCP